MKYYNIFLDAGHGKYTPNKCTPDGISEWSLNNDVCNLIKFYLLHYNCYVFRSDDITGERDVIPILCRLKAANALNADICISIHHNISGDGSYDDGDGTSGVEIFISPDAAENTINFANKASINLKANNTNLKNNGVKKVALSMCKVYSFPAIIVQGGYMNNKSDKTYICSDTGKHSYAYAIASSLIDFYGLVKLDDVAVATISPEYIVADCYTDQSSIKGKFECLSLAIAECDKHTNCYVYDNTGKLLYTSDKKMVLKRVVVSNKSGANLRKKADGYSEIVSSVGRGEVLEIVSKEDQFYLCRKLDNSYRGYIYNKFIIEK